MTPTEKIACPYCNALTTIPAGWAANQKVPCPRCGETFRYKAIESADPAGPIHADVPARPFNSRPRPVIARRPSNRTIAVSVLGLMLLMALISLMVGLKTVPFRRSHDPGNPLAYLPADTNVIALAQVQLALQEVAGRQLLSQLHFGNFGLDLGALEEWTGLRRDDIQTAVLGLRVDDKLPPRFTLVVQTQVPYDEGKLRAALEPERIERGPRTLYHVPWGKQGLGMTFWYASDSILVAALTPADFDAVPSSPWSATDIPLVPALQAYVRDRIGPDAHLWIIGDADHWDQTAAALLVPQISGVSAELLGELKTWGLALHFDDGISVNGACELRTIEVARRLAHQMARAAFVVDLPDWAIALTAAGRMPLAEAALASAVLGSSRSRHTVVQEDIWGHPWVQFRWRSEPGVLLNTLHRPSRGASSLLER
jgi:hypothetical protein